MLRSIVICPDAELNRKLARALEATGAVTVLRTIAGYPTGVDLVRVLRSYAAEVLFLSFESPKEAQEVVRALEQEASHVQVVAVKGTMDPDVLRESMRVGVREFLVDPFERETVRESLTHVKDLLERFPAQYRTTNQIFTFFPSKAGSGASTIALNVSAAMARRKNASVLLSDFDLSSGMLRFLLKLTTPHSVQEAYEHCDQLDDNLWPPMVTSIDGLDVLHAGRVNPNLRLEPTQLRTLIAFIRRNYQSLCFDVSGNLERYSVEVMQESKRILLVCTPEIASLHLAREKMVYFKEFGLHTRVSVILNRVNKRSPFTVPDVEEMLGAPLLYSFPNDYNGVTRALTSGKVVATDSALGKAYAQFAELLAPEVADMPKAPVAGPVVAAKRRFIEFLTTPSEAAFNRDI